MTNPQQLPRTSVGKALVLCTLNWLIPGAGYIAAGDAKRGATLFFVIVGCFAIGVFYGGYILVPAWRWGHEDFNIVSILTYGVQAFFGTGWLLLQGAHAASAGDPQAFFNLQRMAAANAWSDLGVFHLVVSGGLNYLATVRLYDLLAGSPELTESSTGKAHGSQGEAAKAEEQA